MDDNDKEKENIEKEISERKRKALFPGPAGILPDLNECDLNLITIPASKITQKINNFINSYKKKDTSNSNEFDMDSSFARSIKEELLLGQLFLKDPPWNELLAQLKADFSDPNCLLNLMNIKWIQKFSVDMRDKNLRKIPFLAAILIDTPELIVNKTSSNDKKPKDGYRMATFIDHTGAIRVILGSSFYHHYNSYLIPGSAFVLKNMALMRIPDRKTLLGKALMTIAKTNVVCIAYNHNENPKKRLKDEDFSNEYITENGVAFAHFLEFESCLKTAYENYKIMINEDEEETDSDDDDEDSNPKLIQTTTYYNPNLSEASASTSSSDNSLKRSALGPYSKSNSNTNNSNDNSDRSLNSNEQNSCFDFNEEEDEFLREISDLLDI